MKKLIAFISILVCGNVFAQPIFVKATSQGWAGGVCCRQGTDYVITLKGTKKEMEKIKINSVCIGGMKFDSPQATPQYTTSDTLAHLIIRCSYTHDEREFNPGDQIQKETVQLCNELCLNYTLAKKEGKVLITKVEELFYIAYP
jgi:hypothetical protein